MEDDLSWDAEEYEPLPVVTAGNDKWEGEDEEDLRDTWDADENDNNNTDAQVNSVNKKKKKKLQEIIAEKEKRKLEMLERRQKEKEEELSKLNSDEILAEKLRIQKIQEDSDLQIANDLLGVKKDEVTSLDACDVTSESGLSDLRFHMIKKLRSIDRLEKRPFYIAFVEDFCRDICYNLECDDIKRITTVLNTLYNEKVKASKPTKGKKKTGKAKLNPGQGAIADMDGNADDFYNEYDDFI